MRINIWSLCGACAGRLVDCLADGQQGTPKPRRAPRTRW